MLLKEKKIKVKCTEIIDLLPLWNITPFEYHIFRKEYDKADKLIIEGYIPKNEDFIYIDPVIQVRYENLVKSVEKHKGKLIENIENIENEESEDNCITDFMEL